MPNERFLTAGGVRARVVEEGAGDPVLLIHGVAGWAENWAPTMTALAAEGFRAIAVDLPGFGKSQRAVSPRYFDKPDAYYLRFVRELLDALGLERAHLVGHSMGGAVASVAAASFPDRFRSLTLVAPGGYGRQVPLSFRLSSFRLASLIPRLVPTAFVRESVASCFYDPAAAQAWVFEQALVNARIGASAEFARVMHYGVTLRGVRTELIDAWDPEIRGIRLPTLIVWGRQDAVVPVTDLDAVRARLPHARVVLIDRAGHLVQLERPAEFNDALLGFLRSVAAARPVATAAT